MQMAFSFPNAIGSFMDRLLSARCQYPAHACHSRKIVDTRIVTVREVSGHRAIVQGGVELLGGSFPVLLGNRDRSHVLYEAGRKATR